MEEAIEMIENMMEKNGNIAFTMNAMIDKETNKKIKKALKTKGKKYANAIDVLKEVINQLKKDNHEA